MSRRIVFRPQVADDMQDTVAWLEQHASAAVADRFVESVFSALDGLAAMPGKGSPKQFRSRQLAQIRSWAVPGFGHYLIYYQTTAEAIRVLAVTHGGRNLPRLLKDRV